MLCSESERFRFMYFSDVRSSVAIVRGYKPIYIFLCLFTIMPSCLYAIDLMGTSSRASYVILLTICSTSSAVMTKVSCPSRSS